MEEHRYYPYYKDYETNPYRAKQRNLDKWAEEKRRRETNPNRRKKK